MQVMRVCHLVFYKLNRPLWGVLASHYFHSIVGCVCAFSIALDFAHHPHPALAAKDAALITLWIASLLYSLVVTLFLIYNKAGWQNLLCVECNFSNAVQTRKK
jgi:hypothetical protein